MSNLTEPNHYIAIAIPQHHHNWLSNIIDIGRKAVLEIHLLLTILVVVVGFVSFGGRVDASVRPGLTPDNIIRSSFLSWLV